MQEDVAVTAQATFCATLVDEFVRAGVTDAVIAPGSRSTPLALALSARPDVRVHVFHDERAAGFCALGFGLATRRPAVVVTTSGTAATHLHAAVVEADLAGVPLLVCTADRPPELRDVAAPQTIDQTHLFGRSPRWFFDPGVADDAMRDSWRSIAARAVALTTGDPPGPVHLNLPFRDPLVAEPDPLPAGRPDGAPWVVRHAVTPTCVEAPAGRTVVIGKTPGDCGFPVIADARTGLEGPSVIVHADAVLRHASLTPDVIVRVGPQPASRIVNEWAAASGAHEIVVSRVWSDPAHTASEIAGGCILGPPDEAWMAQWRAASDAAAAAIHEILDDPATASEPFVARELLRSMLVDSELVVASSMPVRDLEWYAVPRAEVRVHANRGANGIDGTISTAIGVALSSGHATAVLLGDIAFLHDSTALVGIKQRGIDLTIVVIDNDGGGIFSFLPQAATIDAERFEQLFGTPHGVKPEALAAAHGIAALTIEDPSAFAPAIRSTMTSGGVWLVVVRTDRSENVKVHQALNDAVAGAIDALGANEG
ncbi:MAG: 2-succinyl-5-enolpyruvyl-6-hydroxy-3-cyclohexene-carboxylate synthase [Acidimicrobiaceae bacterium]